MSNRKVRDLPIITGDTTGIHFVVNNSSNTTTHTVTKEVLFAGYATTSSLNNYATTGSNTFSGSQVIDGNLTITGTTILGGNIVPKTPRGATLGTLEDPFADIFVSSGSINIAGIPGQPNTTLSNVSGAILISAGGMQLVGSASFVAQTGSFQYISGSMKQVGNYTQVGNYSISGSKSITGSLNITGSGFINSKRILTELDSGSYAITGSNIFNGNQIITGSVTLSSGSALYINDSFHVNGNKQFNYGQFYSTGSQTNPVANVSHSMVYETLDFASGFNVVSGSRLTNTNKGVYNLQFSSQFQQTTNVDSNFSIWFRKNGLNISGSNTEVSIAKNSKGTSEVVAAWNYLYQANANDYIEIMWSSPDTHLEILYGGTQTNPNRPTTPSVIVTVTQIA
jgi:hypothetical protein